ncbi:MAG TPA: polysaccharide biosynthesis tyrosine autokinase [Stellaceae bacterium]|nr:polysaccharide biosynthesis tyrosine autokinase [Stellaceae bacterium]
MPDDRLPPEISEAADVQRGFDLRGTLSFVWRQWKLIAAITCVALVVGTVYMLNETPLYTATTELLFDWQQRKAPGSLDTVYSDPEADIAAIEAQMAVIQSTVFLRRVVEREHLALPTAIAARAPGNEKTPLAELVSPAIDYAYSLIPTSWAEVIRNEVEPQPVEGTSIATDGKPRPLDELQAVGALKGALKVSRTPKQRYVLAISVTSPDPMQAARLANAVSDAFLVDKLDTRFEAAKRASAWLSDRLTGLREQLRESEEAVAAFRAQHGLVQSGSLTLNQQQVSELNAKLIDARAELAQKSARVSLLNAFLAKGANLQTMPDIADAGDLPNLRLRASALSAEEADLLARFGEAHPRVVNIRAQRRDIDRAIEVETQRLSARIKNDYQLAQARVSSLEKSLQQATGQTNLDDATAIRLRELERTAAVNKSLFEDYLKQAKLTHEQSTFEPQDVRVITPALAPGGPSYPNTNRFILLSLFVGLFTGVAGALAKEKLDSGFSTPKQVEDLLGLPLLASVNRLISRERRVDGKTVPIYQVPIAKPLSRYGESIRWLRTGIHMTDVDQPPKVVQITSAVPNEGKTTIALSMAASAAAAKVKVLLIDADLRHPAATRIFDLQKKPGLVDLLLGKATVQEAIQFQEKSGYWVLGAGNKTQNPTDLLGSQRMKAMLEAFKGAYDLVVLDTPPMGPVVDPSIIAQLCDKVVLVVRWGSTPRALVKDCVEKLQDRRKFAGVAFNLVNERAARKYDAYTFSYYGKRYYSKYYGS